MTLNFFRPTKKGQDSSKSYPRFKVIMFNFLFCLIFGFSSSVSYNVQNFELFEQKIFQFLLKRARKLALISVVLFL